MFTASSTGLEARNIFKSYGGPWAVAGISLHVKKGEFFTILGPSGSGKTTLLRLIAGFEIPDKGDILLEGKNITEIDPVNRNVGMVFQNYALFPHLTVEKNIGFPLKMRGLSSPEIKNRVNEMLELVNLASLRNRTPRELSGGQQQRVALARAIVFHPSILLLDEPFSALDRKLRELMQLEVRRLQKTLGLTTIFITHDQEEALVMSDRIAVLNDGCVEQVGSSQEIYDAPANAFVADFIGESNILTGVVETHGGVSMIYLDHGPFIGAATGVSAGDLGRKVRVLIRPERFYDEAVQRGQASSTNQLEGVIVDKIYTGISQKCRVRTNDGLEILVILKTVANGPRYLVRDAVKLGFDPLDVRIVGIGDQ